MKIFSTRASRSARLALLGSVALLPALAGCEREVNRGPVANLTTVSSYREALVSQEEIGETGTDAASTGTGWATIRGQFVYDGTPPVPEPYNVDKERGICTVNGQPPLQETLIVDSGTKGIKNVAVYLRDAPRVHESAATINEPAVFDQQVCVFLTHVMGAAVGQTIEIKNSDPTGHNTNIIGSGFNQSIPAGASTGFTPQKEVAVPMKVVCNIHPWMLAYILTRENAYFDVSNEQGQFEIANVPAGVPIELQVWHESGAAASNGLVGATPDSPELNWSNRGRVTVTLQPDEVKEIKVIVPPNAFRG